MAMPSQPAPSKWCSSTTAADRGRAAPFSFTVGLDSGEVLAGNVGGAGRLEFTVIGDVVNVAARVEAATRQTGDVILVTERVRERLEPEQAALLEAREHVELRGKRESVRVYAALVTTAV